MEGGATNLLPLVDLGEALSASFLLALALLEESLRDENLVVGCDSPGLHSDQYAAQHTEVWNRAPVRELQPRRYILRFG